MALNLIPRLPSLSVLAAADNVCRIDLTVLFPDCASIEIGVPPNQPHSVDVQPSTIYVTVSGPTVTVPPHGDYTHGPGAGGSVWPVTTTCDEEGLVTAMPMPTGSPSGPGGPGSGGPGSGGPGSGGPGSGGPGSGGPGNGGPGSGNNGPGNGNNGPGSGNNNPSPSSTTSTTSTTLSTLTTAIRTSLPTPTTTSCLLPPFLSISTTLADLLDLDLKLYLDLASLTSGVASLLVPSLPGDAAGPLRALHAAQEVIDQQTR
ncbi:hypothetical protein QR685DRAFT_20042 [Neurospora intermedia]|uniref:Uncharacterized protein n=1 Tax=Neurospora intermedia TaxID=5142 RepID=A0ABR3DPW1_NEUIN